MALWRMPRPAAILDLTRLGVVPATDRLLVERREIVGEKEGRVLGEG